MYLGLVMLPTPSVPTMHLKDIQRADDKIYPLTDNKYFIETELCNNNMYNIYIYFFFC